MIRQYNSGYGRRWKGVSGLVGPIEAGAIFYLHVNGFGAKDEFFDEPWQVVGWLNRDTFVGGCNGRRAERRVMAGGHLALVKSLRTGQVKKIACHYLYAAEQNGLQYPHIQRQRKPRHNYGG